MLMTPELERVFSNHPPYSQEGTEAKVIAKFFNPCGLGTWLITEAEKQEDGDWLLFGYCHIYEWEWGYVSLRELESCITPFGLPIERDISAEGKRVKDCL